MSETNLRQANAKATAVGIVSDKNLEIKTENGIRRIEGTITVKTSDTNFVVWHVRCPEKKNDGSENKVFTGMMTVYNEYKSIAEVGEDEADRVRVSGQINLFRSANTGQEIVSYTSNFFNRVKNGQVIEPKAEFEIEVFIKAIVPEITKDGEETGRVKINGWVPTYRGIEPVELIVPEENASDVESIYEPGQTATFYGDINQNTVFTTVEKAMAFGKKKETKTEFINDLIVTGGSPAYDGEEGEEGANIPYNPDVIRAAIAERDRLIEEAKNKAASGTGNVKNNTKPSGASRGRTLGW